jgi:hypothetical protein
MVRRVFYSFNYDEDNWRVSQVKQMGAVEGQTILGSNAWEDVEAGGKPAIKEYIDKEMSGKSCLVVLIGAHTANREWIDYEIKKAWDEGKGVIGVRINKLLDRDGKASSAGANPFSAFTIKNGTVRLDSVVDVYTPAGSSSTDAYAFIRDNIASWVEAGIAKRSQQ